MFIPENSTREIIYVNKRLFCIARRRNADYVVPITHTPHRQMHDRRVSNDGIKVSVSIEFDQAEISARRYSSSPVIVNEAIRLEYTWLTLVNGDTLTFADGSRYTFYNIYNQRDIDEIPVDEQSMVRYVRQNMLDENNRVHGRVSSLQKETDFDSIPHQAEEAEFEEDYDDGDVEMDMEEAQPEEEMVMETDLIPKLIR